MPERRSPCLGNSGDPVANMLSSAAKHFMFIRFLRPGKWAVPVKPGKPGSAWAVTALDYWAMDSSATVLDPAATNATIEVPSIPFNVMIMFEPGSGHKK